MVLVTLRLKVGRPGDCLLDVLSKKVSAIVAWNGLVEKGPPHGQCDALHDEQ